MLIIVFLYEHHQHRHCVVYDSLVKGHAAAVPNGTPLIVADVADGTALRRAL